MESSRFFFVAQLGLWPSPNTGIKWELLDPETNIFAPENGWLEYDCFPLGWPIFRGEMAVSFRKGTRPDRTGDISISPPLNHPALAVQNVKQQLEKLYLGADLSNDHIQKIHNLLPETNMTGWLMIG